MIKRGQLILAESLNWIKFCIKYKVNYKKVVLVLTGENKKLDYYTLAYLKNFMERKCAVEAVILYDNINTKKLIELFSFPFQIKTVFCSTEKMRNLYKYYSFEKFFDNIVFTYTTIPKDNLLGRILSETKVTEQEAVCLGLYHLREVLDVEAEYMENEYAC